MIPAAANTMLFTDGKLSARFVSPTHIVSDKTNENSAVVWMDYGGKTFYYTGDADAADLGKSRTRPRGRAEGEPSWIEHGNVGSPRE